MRRRKTNGRITQLAVAVAALATLLLLTACELNIGAETLEGSGIAKTSRRQTSNFTRVDLRGSARVTIVAGRSRTVTVRGDDNLLGDIRTEVKGETLTISNRHPFKSEIGITVEIEVPTLTGVEVGGSGTVTVEKLASDSFGVDLSGSGELTIDGTAKRLSFSISGSGDVKLHGLAAQELHADISGSGSIEATGKTQQLDLDVSGDGRLQFNRLVAREARVNVSGSSDVEIRVTGSLAVDVSGSGDITYAGNPTSVTRDVSGSGSINAR